MSVYLVVILIFCLFLFMMLWRRKTENEIKGGSVNKIGAYKYVMCQITSHHVDHIKKFIDVGMFDQISPIYCGSVATDDYGYGAIPGYYFVLHLTNGYNIYCKNADGLHDKHEMKSDNSGPLNHMDIKTYRDETEVGFVAHLNEMNETYESILRNKHAAYNITSFENKTYAYIGSGLYNASNQSAVVKRKDFRAIDLSDGVDENIIRLINDMKEWCKENYKLMFNRKETPIDLPYGIFVDQYTPLMLGKNIDRFNLLLKLAPDGRTLYLSTLGIRSDYVNPPPAEKYSKWTLRFNAIENEIITELIYSNMNEEEKKVSPYLLPNPRTNILSKYGIGDFYPFYIPTNGELDTDPKCHFKFKNKQSNTTCPYERGLFVRYNVLSPEEPKLIIISGRYPANSCVYPIWCDSYKIKKDGRNNKLRLEFNISGTAVNSYTVSMNRATFKPAFIDNKNISRESYRLYKTHTFE